MHHDITHTYRTAAATTRGNPQEATYVYVIYCFLLSCSLLGKGLTGSPPSFYITRCSAGGARTSRVYPPYFVRNIYYIADSFVAYYAVNCDTIIGTDHTSRTHISPGWSRFTTPMGVRKINYILQCCRIMINITYVI